MGMDGAAESLECAERIADAHSDWTRVRDGSLPRPGDIVLCLPDKQSLHMGVVLEGGLVFTSTQDMGAYATKIERMLGVIGFYRFNK